MYNTLKIAWYFYKPTLVWCLLATFACIYYVLSRQLNIPLAFLCKLFSYASILGIQYLNFNSTKTYFYFRNAGYSVRRLYFYVFSFDLITFSILLSLSTIR
ncbi:hypothetical protein [Mucilaginibacter sp.]|uniref:hypothetical protein n=1 Tax=Mucilaginibacter sp. TaxID=1882438 RepID=UPI0025D9A2E0|nr:hypothetical protein [Mucilaginibacter sp.]